jgi:hypothetical protein
VVVVTPSSTYRSMPSVDVLASVTKYMELDDMVQNNIVLFRPIRKDYIHIKMSSQSKQHKVVLVGFGPCHLDPCFLVT